MRFNDRSFTFAALKDKYDYKIYKYAFSYDLFL